MFEPRNIQRRSARPSQPITTIKDPPSDERRRIEGTFSLDSFWTAIDAPASERPGGQSGPVRYWHHAPLTSSTAASPPRPPLPRAGED
jgi:hypothetical protein